MENNLRSGFVTELIALYESLRQDLVRFIMAKVRSAEDAEDIVQHVYLQLVNMTDEKCKDIGDNRSYIFGVANMLALNHMRKQGRANRLFSSEDEVERTDDVDDPGRVLASRQTMEVLKQAISVMPAKRRQVFMYYRFRNMSVKDIAGEMDLSVSAVEKHIVRALSLCREHLKEAGLA